MNEIKNKTSNSSSTNIPLIHNQSASIPGNVEFN